MFKKCKLESITLILFVSSVLITFTYSIIIFVQTLISIREADLDSSNFESVLRNLALLVCFVIIFGFIDSQTMAKKYLKTDEKR